MARKTGEVKLRIYFSDVFAVSERSLDDYGALNISLINDLPLFIDPFLLFNSEESKYQELHKSIIEYVAFLRDQAQEKEIDENLLLDWFTFKEVKQNWLGFCKAGNDGRGLGRDFAKSLHINLHNIFKDFGSEKLTRGTHLEKLCLIKDGVGRDNVSDFTTCLIKHHICEFTERFAKDHLHSSQRKLCQVAKAQFSYKTKTWMTRSYELPFADGDFVLLTPKDLLTKDDSWISRSELLDRFPEVVDAVHSKLLKAQLDRYLRERLVMDASMKERKTVYEEAIEKYPEIIEYYVRLKEEEGDEAAEVSQEKVAEALAFFVTQVKKLATTLYKETDFYETRLDSFESARKRALFLKDVIENNDGYRIFYLKGKAIQREEDLQILYRLTWYATIFDVNREPNNGRGPVDFKVSKGSEDKALVEMKLASNKKLKQNLQKQVAIYEKANSTSKSIKVILYFSDIQRRKVDRIFRELGLSEKEEFVLIDANRNNKISASRA